ncbi:MAG: LysR family transcriptional regulator [Acidobacteria bacterium]|nr:LysR family transcriptional regulator [Acidobacteriota bacterium]
MNIAELQVFLAIASERSFSKAAGKLHRTQSAVSQALKRLEDQLGERLVDRSSKDGRLTEAGRVLRDYAERLMRLADEAETAVHELRDLQRGRVLIGANESTVHSLIPLIVSFHEQCPAVHVDVRRAHARQVGAEVATGSLDFGILTFRPAEAGLGTIVIDEDDLVLLVPPAHPFAKRRVVHMAEVGRQPIVAHNDPSPARDRVLRIYEQRHEELNIRVSLPSLDAIKRAVEMGLGIAVLPRRCALAELSRGELVALRIPELRLRRQLRLVYRKTGEHSHAAHEFLRVAHEVAGAHEHDR